MSALADIAEAVGRAAATATDEDRALLEEGQLLLAGEELISIGEVAEILGVSSPTTIRNWFERGVFQGAVRTEGNHRRFRLEDVLAVKARMALTKAENEAGRIEIPEFETGDPYAVP